MNDLELLRQSRRLGELEGAAFDAALAARERAERGERLSRIALGGDEADLPVADDGAPPRRDVAELESRLRELSHFHDAVTRSQSWRMLQRLRGLFGRAW